jgi:hypothetical protein
LIPLIRIPPFFFYPFILIIEKPLAMACSKIGHKMLPLLRKQSRSLENKGENKEFEARQNPDFISKPFKIN